MSRSAGAIRSRTIWWYWLWAVGGASFTRPGCRCLGGQASGAAGPVSLRPGIRAVDRAPVPAGQRHLRALRYVPELVRPPGSEVTFQFVGIGGFDPDQ